MDLSIYQRLIPFSHIPGITLLLPGSTLCVKVYPCLLRLYALEINGLNLLEEFHLDFQGPLDQFTVSSDLEKMRITVSGKTKEGWVRYHLLGQNDSQRLHFFLDRFPEEFLTIRAASKKFDVFKKESTQLLEKSIPCSVEEPCLLNHLSFGNHKAQDIELIKRRLDLTEIFPLWNKLGQIVPSFMSREGEIQGTFALLEECRENLKSGKPEKARQLWINLFQAGFEGIFVPRSTDSDYLGLTRRDPIIDLKSSPIVLLSEGARLIRDHFIQQKGVQVSILPHLLPELPFGRLEGVVLSDGVSRLSLEWSKKTIRRLVLHANQNQELQFNFHHNVRDYRLRNSHKDRGERKKKDSLLLIDENQSYFFDNFL